MKSISEQQSILIQKHKSSSDLLAQAVSLEIQVSFKYPGPKGEENIRIVSVYSLHWFVSKAGIVSLKIDGVQTSGYTSSGNLDLSKLKLFNVKDMQDVKVMTSKMEPVIEEYDREADRYINYIVKR